MRLKVIGTGSSGNCYLLGNDTEALLIECGLPFAQIKRALDYDLRKVKACIVSHSHKDHSLSIPDLQRSGIPVYGPSGIYPDIEASHNQRRRFVSFTVRPLAVEHDVHCLAYVISHPDMGRLLFVTDTYSFPYRVKGLNHILMEANYCDRKLEQNIDAGLIPDSLRQRIVTSHMEIGMAVTHLTAQDLSKVRNILLIHLSQGNSEPDNFKTQVEAATGIPTQIAVPGLEMELNVEPY